MVLELGVRDGILGALDPPTHRDSGFMHRIRIAGDQRVPPIEVTALRDQFVAATRRQPVQLADILRRQPDAIWNLLGAILIVLAGTKAGIQQPA